MVPSVVSDVFRRLSELLERLIKVLLDFVVALGNAEFELDVPNNLHSSSVWSEVVRTTY